MNKKNLVINTHTCRCTAARLVMIASGLLFEMFLHIVQPRPLPTPSTQNYTVVISVVDPHPSALIWLSWIRIRIGNEDPDPDMGANKLPKLTNKPEF
jgi:hypothetical protein